MQFDRPPLLVVGVTGRALAESAARAGHPVVVLDYFADRDTCAVATACRAVVSSHGLRFDRRMLLSAAQALAPAADSGGMVYGSGFEGRIGLLTRLVAGRRLFGNPPEVVASVRDPLRIFPLLDRLGIPHPEVALLPPADPSGWLVKHCGGGGGAHVRPADRRPSRAGAYFQRLHPGRAYSALFLADGRRACILGFNEQWNSAARPELPHLYGGALGQIGLPAPVEAELRDRLDAVVAATGLVGLNGIDFLIHEDRWSALEINPRPTATMELYDADYDRGLFEAHLEACLGHLPTIIPPSGATRASRIVHAPGVGLVSADLDFPPWAHDLPQPGARFSPGDPLCTVFAEAKDAATATRLVRDRQHQVERLFLDAASGALRP